MGKLSLNAASLYHPSSLTHRVPVRATHQKPLTDPVRIETEGRRWLAVLTAVACERRVAQELNAIGFSAYCPLGRKTVSWQGGRQLKTKLIREFPVLSRYVLVGTKGRPVNRDDSEKIIAVLGDSQGPICIPPTVIARINTLELAGEWDAATYRPSDSPYRPGVAVTIPRGQWAGFPATVDAQESETRLKVLVTMFGRQMPVSVGVEEVELCA